MSNKRRVRIQLPQAPAAAQTWQESSLAWGWLQTVLTLASAGLAHSAAERIGMVASAGNRAAGARLDPDGVTLRCDGTALTTARLATHKPIYQTSEESQLAWEWLQSACTAVAAEPAKTAREKITVVAYSGHLARTARLGPDGRLVSSNMALNPPPYKDAC